MKFGLNLYEILTTVYHNIIVLIMISTTTGHFIQPKIRKKFLLESLRVAR